MATPERDRNATLVERINWLFDDFYCHGFNDAQRSDEKVCGDDGEDCALDSERKAILAEVSALSSPINMLLFCPECHKQHVDAPNEAAGWTNPPHRGDR